MAAGVVDTGRLQHPERAWAIVEESAARLEKGLSALPDWYIDPDIFELERQRVFAKTWQLVCTTEDVAEPGQYQLVRIDDRTQFIVVRGQDGVIRGFHNVCAHRGNILVGNNRDHAPVPPECGVTRQFTCSYHAWSYGLDGSLKHAPGIDQLPNFRKQEWFLAPASVDTWGPFVFLNPDPEAKPLREHLGDIPDRVSKLGIDMEDVAKQGNSLAVEGVLECNWKIAVENSIECYHCASAHPGFADSVDLPKWQIRLRGSCIIQGTRARQVDTLGLDPENPKKRMGRLTTEAALAEEGGDLAWFHWMFPNNSVSVWPGPANSFNVARWIPLSPTRTKWWSVRWWPATVPDEVRNDQWKFMSDVGWEDQEIVENQQIGISSGAWKGGPLFLAGDDHAPTAPAPPHMDPSELQQIRDERGIQLFNLLVARSLTLD